MSIRLQTTAILAVALLIALIATLGVIALHRNADNYRQAEILVARVEGLANRLKRLELQAENAKTVTPELDQEAREIRTQMRQDLDELLLYDASGVTAQQIHTAFQQYRLDNEKLFELFTGGASMNEVDEWDEEHSDPSYDRLYNGTTSASTIYRMEAEQANRAAAIWTTITAALTAILIGLLFWRFEKIRRSADLLATEQSTLRRSEERFRSLVRNASDVIMIIDAQGFISYHSPAAERVWGYTSERLDGQTLLDFINPVDQYRAKNLLAQALTSPAVNITTELRLQQVDTTWRDYEVIVNNLLDVDSLSGIVVTFHDITQHKAYERELADLAFYDPLTKLPNRALFMDRLERALSRADRYKDPVALLFLDLDNFKVINDSLGHQAGDRLLVAVAERLRASIGSMDTIARFGGDEFMILLEDILSVGDAVRVAERLAAALQTPILLAEREVVATASIGIALSSQYHDQPNSLLRDADLAMYRAKSTGKNHYALFDQEMNARAFARLEMEADLRHALERSELLLYYQPIALLNQERICELEALVRWRHPSRGIISPAEFIPLAEETGLIIPLGQWILEEACRQTRSWQQQFGNLYPLVINVNLSARQFQHPNLINDITRILAETELDPASLKLEITESVMMQDAEATRVTLQHLKELGVKLAIDDFGTGYSSLAYLKRFPIDVLKIDRSFIERLGQDADDTAIVNTIITLAKTLNLCITAEGIETSEQYLHLRNLACDRGQGYFISHPVPAAQIPALITQQPAAAMQGGTPATKVSAR